MVDGALALLIDPLTQQIGIEVLKMLGAATIGEVVRRGFRAIFDGRKPKRKGSKRRPK